MGRFYWRERVRRCAARACLINNVLHAFDANQRARPSNLWLTRVLNLNANPPGRVITAAKIRAARQIFMPPRLIASGTDDFCGCCPCAIDPVPPITVLLVKQFHCERQLVALTFMLN
jgi:hypothetical protein